jgi:hypothetical protein
MGAASVFSDLLTIEALSTSTIPGSGTASIEASQIPVLRADISGWIVDSRPSAWVGPAFEIRYLALLSKTELPLETFAEYLVGQAPKPDGTFNVIDATWDEELFANTRGQHPFLATLRGALAYQLDEATVRYGGWAYSGFFLLAGEYVELDFFNTVRVSVELPSGATLSSASGFDYAAAPVPEPSAAAMLILGLAMLGYYSCRSGVGRAGHGRAA